MSYKIFYNKKVVFIWKKNSYADITIKEERRVDL